MVNFRYIKVYIGNLLCYFDFFFLAYCKFEKYVAQIYIIHINLERYVQLLFFMHLT